MFQGNQNSVDALLRSNAAKRVAAIARGWSTYVPGTGRPCCLYMVWSSMRARCRNPKHRAYKYYGARGITVCDAWHGYPVFRAWAIATGYRKNLTIDRRDNDGNYEPGNCRWITIAEQNRNRRPARRAR